MSLDLNDQFLILFLGEMKMISGEGMPIYRRSHENGNLFIQFEIKFPANGWAPMDKIAKLEQILPPRPAPPAGLNSKTVDDYTLEPVDPTRQAGGGSRSRDDHMDEDGGEGPSVQCAQQ